MGATSMTAAAGGAAGSSPPSPVIAPDSRDDSAQIWVGTGSAGATTGTLVTVTFGSNYSSSVDAPSPPRVWVSGGNAAASALGLQISSATGRQVVITCSVAPSNGLPASSSGLVINLRMDA